MKFHPPHVSSNANHSFAINDHGTAVQFSFSKGSSVVEMTGEEAKEMRSWLNAAELRTDDEHAAVMAEEAKNPTKEINSGTKVEMNDWTLDEKGNRKADGTHAFAQDPDELKKLQDLAHQNLVKSLAAEKAAKSKPN